MNVPPPPPHVRARLARILAEQLRREHPDAIVEVVNTRPGKRDPLADRPPAASDHEPPDDR